MNGSQLPTNLLHVINWDALNHASRAPSINVIITTIIIMYVYVCMYIAIHHPHVFIARAQYLAHYIMLKAVSCFLTHHDRELQIPSHFPAAACTFDCYCI